MYSVVLLMSMTATTDTPACHRAYYGCYGGYYNYNYSCCGYYSGCYGYYNNSYYGGYGYYGNTYVVPQIIGSTVQPQTLGNQAQIHVTLPESARLYVDSHLTTSTSSVRDFTTPALEPGKDFNYVLTAVMQQGGKEVKLEKTVAVRAGQITNVAIEFPSGVALK